MIRLQNIGKSFGTKDLFSNFNFQFPKDEKIALIGSNGSGKTTLLNLINESERPDSGNIIYPKNLQLGFLTQEFSYSEQLNILDYAQKGAQHISNLKIKLDQALTALEKEPTEKNIQHHEEIETAYKNSGGYAIKQKAESLLQGLGFRKKQFEQSPNQLSGGWQMRLEMAKMFLNNPNFVILDEPTNHLDLPSLLWFEKYLQTFTGTLLFVSHDLELINRLSTMIVHLENGQANVYRGNYNAFLKQRTEALRLKKTTHENLTNKKEQLQQFVTRFKAKASKAKQAQSKQKIVDKLNDQLSKLSIPDNEQKISVLFPPPPQCNRIAYQIQNGSIGYKEQLFKNINLIIEKNQKIAAIGPNGIGKSTLLKSIANLIPSLGGTFKAADNLCLAYFSQHLTDQLDENLSLLDAVLKHSSASQQEARSILGALLFKNDDVFKKINVLSGGEKNRVSLACTLIKKANMLLLDEPTNHLDIESIDSLINALKQYKGCILLVSHNRAFINSVSSHILACSTEKSMQLFSGNLNDYPHLAKLSNFPNVLEENLSKTETKTTKNNTTSLFLQQKLLTKEKNKIKNKIKKIEQDLDKIKTTTIDLQKQLDQAIQEKRFDDLKEINKKLTQIKEEEKSKEEEWIDISAKLESFKEKTP